MPQSVTAKLATFGGVVGFTVSGYATGATAHMTIGRSDSSSGGPFSNLYSGPPTPFFVDVGDNLPTPLLSGSTYYWNFQDPSGTVIVGPITPVGMLLYDDDGLTALIIRCLQAGIDNIGVQPKGIKRATVMQDMPLNGFPALPLVSVTAQLEDQELIGIGQNIENIIPYENQLWTMPTASRKIWRISVFASDTATRDYYKRLCVNVMISLIPSILINLGQNVTHKYMVNVGQMAEEIKNKTPGFYFADILFEITGLANVNTKTNYSIVTGAVVGIQSSPNNTDTPSILTNVLVTGSA